MLNYTEMNSDTEELANYIHDDCEDTISKLSQAFPFFTQLVAYGSGSKTLTDEEWAELLDDLGFDASRGDTFTLCLRDGDIVAFQVDVVSHSVYVLNSSGEITDKIIDNGVFRPGVVIETVKGSYQWSLGEIAYSLADQIQTCSVFSKLASLGTQATVSFADVSAVFANYAGGLSSAVTNFRNLIIANLNQLSPAFLVYALKQAYNAFAEAVTSDDSDTIDFAEEDFKVASFCGTLVWQLVISGASMLGGVLMIAGGAVAKIAGVVISGLAAVGGVVLQALSTVTDVRTTATYSFTSDQLEYAQPIFTKKVTLNDVIRGSIDPELLSKLEKYRLLRIRYPSFNVYAWIHEGVLYFQGFLVSTLAKIDLTQTVGLTPFWLESLGDDNYRLRISSDSTPVELTDKYAYNYTSVSNFDGHSTHIPSRWIIPDTVPTDSQMRTSVTNALFMAYYQLFNLFRTCEHSSPISMNTGFNIINSINVASWPITNDTLPHFVANVCHYGLQGQAYAPAWTVIVNTLVPALRSFVDNIAISNLVHGLFGMIDANGRRSLVGTGHARRNFNQGFAITPPNYSAEAVVGAVVLTLVAAAAVAIAIAASSKLISRKLDRVMTNSYAKVQEKYADYAGDSSNVAKQKDYLKSVRRYNFLARLTGYSTLSTVQGWETGDAGSSPDLDEALNSLSGTDEVPSDTVSDSFNDIAKLIRGPFTVR